jgi:hypothetical protein
VAAYASLPSATSMRPHTPRFVEWSLSRPVGTGFSSNRGVALYSVSASDISIRAHFTHANMVPSVCWRPCPVYGLGRSTKGS